MKSKLRLSPTCPDTISVQLPGDDFRYLNACCDCPSAGECAEQKRSRLDECPNIERLANLILDTAFPDPNDPRRNDLDLVDHLFDKAATLCAWVLHSETR